MWRGTLIGLFIVALLVSLMGCASVGSQGPTPTGTSEGAPIEAAQNPDDAARMAVQYLANCLSVSASDIKVVRAERAELSLDRLFMEEAQRKGLSLPAQVFGYEVVLRSSSMDREYHCYVYRNQVICPKD